MQNLSSGKPGLFRELSNFFSAGSLETMVLEQTFFELCLSIAIAK